MTTPTDTAGHPDPDARDELASAYLDGATTAEENARVERDVDLLRRVEELAAVRDALAVEAQPAAAADVALAAALAAFDADAATRADAAADGPTEAGATVTDLGERRRRLTERVPLGAVAAAVAAVALVVGVTQIDFGGEQSDMATGAATADDAGDSEARDLELDSDSAEFDSTAGAGAGGAAESFGDDGALDSAPVAGDSGFAPADDDGRTSYADIDQLAAGLRDRLAAEDGDAADGGTASGPDDGATRSSDPCDAVAVVGIEREAVQIVESVLLSGDPVTAVVFVDSDGMEQLAVVDDTTCQLEAERPL